MTEHAEELGVDADRIGIGGDSAGASLAALVCSRYEEENVKMPLFQMLVYPFTDGSMETESMKALGQACGIEVGAATIAVLK